MNLKGFESDKQKYLNENIFVVAYHSTNCFRVHSNKTESFGMFRLSLLLSVVLIAGVLCQSDDRLTAEEIEELKNAYSQPRMENRFGIVSDPL